MKNNINVIKINGIRGLILAGFVVICLAAGFILFPGLLCTKIWNLVSAYAEQIPKIGIIQGTLLWGIIVAAYFTFKKDKLVVCLRHPQELSEEELKAVFADIKKSYQQDYIVQNMLKARETELKIKNLRDNIPEHKLNIEKQEQLNNK